MSFLPRVVLLLACFVVLSAPASQAETYDLPARAAILIDDTTGQILFEKNADEALPPASMSKLMTAYMVFSRLKEGSLSLDDTFPVSEKAWRKGGSKMFVEVNTRVKISDLLRGIIIQSGNDACIVVAEGIGGTEDNFATMMTDTAKEIGLRDSTFRNASGWPDPDHLMSVRDLALLARTIIHEFPQYYDIYGEKDFEYNGIVQYSRNPLLQRNVPGVDGLKTGYTDEAGYGLVASAERDGRRLIMVIAGLESANARSQEGERLLEYGYRHFNAYRLFTAGETVENASVWLGDATSVPLVPKRDVVVSLSREARRDLEVKLVYDGPIPAPIDAGTEIAKLQISVPNQPSFDVPLTAGETVDAASLVGRARSALSYLIWGPTS